jgi:nucleoside phosphorylase
MAASNESLARRRAVILTTLAVEYRAVRAYLGELREEIDLSSGTIYEVGSFLAPSGNWEIVIAQVGMGSAAASIGTERALLRFRPEVLLLVGVAGGISPGATLGDVVVATQVIRYDRSRLPRVGEPLFKFEVLQSSCRLLQRAQVEAAREAWLARRRHVTPTEPPPRVFIGKMASGEEVIDGHGAQRLSHRDVLAIDMEAFGLLEALHGTPDVDVLVVRGIADLMDGSKVPEARDVAAHNASAFAFEVLARLDETRTTQTVTRTATAAEPLVKRYLTRIHISDIRSVDEIAAFPRLVRHLSLFSERAALTESLAWLKDLRFKQLEQNPEGKLLASLKQFINESGVLPQGARLAEVSSEAVTFVDGNGCPVALEELSDGFRSVLSLTLDLLRHLATAYGASGVFSRVDPTRVIAPGLVLIDEVDVHLHPTWQHQLGHWFRTHFPEIQFIVTTHSPLVCQAADTVFLLTRPGIEERGRMLVGVELDRVRHGNVLDAYGTGVFGHGVTRSEVSKALLQRLAELNARENSPPRSRRSRSTCAESYQRGANPPAVSTRSPVDDPPTCRKPARGRPRRAQDVSGRSRCRAQLRGARRDGETVVHSAQPQWQRHVQSRSRGSRLVETDPWLVPCRLVKLLHLQIP